MKKELLTVKELAAELRMSVNSIQRAYREGDIPVQWLRRMARFNLGSSTGNGTQCTKPMLRLKTTATVQGATSGAAAGAHRRNAPGR